MTTTYRITIYNTGAGFEAARHGIHQPKRDSVLAWTEKHLVLKAHGYGENPGSRHSGLHSYYPTEIDILEIIEWLGENELRCRPLVSYEARKPQDKVQHPNGPTATRI